MGVAFQSLATFTELFAWEKPVYHRLPWQRPIRSSKCIKGTCNFPGISKSYKAKESNIGMNEQANEKLLIDCGPDQQCVVGGIVALGKFDALHVGHRELAIQASKVGVPFLLSFVGIAEVLGWEKRLPIVANCDRKRVLSLWAPLCGGMVPHEYHVQFSLVRHLSPRQFVERLSKELGVKGVVAGANYRFGYKASGDASDLVQLCDEYGLKAFIVDPVMYETNKVDSGQTNIGTSIHEKGQVSSTLIRSALHNGSIKHVTKLLGRKHRLVLSSNGCEFTATTLVASISNALNQPPGKGQYSCTTLVGLINNKDQNSHLHERVIGSAHLEVDADNLLVKLHERNFLENLNDVNYVYLDLEDSH
eukprot:TRINITY_DN2905_c0_g1_i1.p1 TRINITY_DN2905_c0_g1~~TRINITY_DN2905_c0_g1_i1.p1  ORF type:complete len:362 (-),score=73.41 TRINITY_DN2905_c0_g1_i1:58-1143(-)